MSLQRCFIVPIIAAVLTFAAASGGVHAQSVTVEHELGVTEVPVAPERVVVFDFGVLDTLDALGVPVTGVPKGNVPPYLAKFEGSRYANVGTLLEPDYEAINELKPELIIISGRQSDHYEQLSRLAPTVYMGVDNERYAASMEENLRTLGRIFGVEAHVEEALAQLHARLERVRAMAGDKNALVLLVTGGRANAYGPGSRYGFIHDEFGLQPVNDRIDASTHGQVISWEFVLVHDPDLLLVVDRDAVVEGGGQTARQVVENDLVKLTRAYTQGNITYLDPGYWYLSGGGLQSFAKMASDIEDALRRAQP